MRDDVALQVFFSSDIGAHVYRDREFGCEIKWDVPVVEGYSHTFLHRDPKGRNVTAWGPGARGLRKKLREFTPDVALFTAYGGRFWIEALVAVRALGVPVMLRHEASDDAVQRSRVKNVLRSLVLRAFYARVAGFAAIGTAARRHLLRFGVPDEAIGRAPYNVDSDFFAAEAARWLPQRPQLRNELRIPENHVALLFAGKLISKKGVDLVLKAVRLLPLEIRERLHWLVLGEGELREGLEREARAVFGDRVHFAGFVNQRELGRWYAAADVMVLPSRARCGETWGLVVNEAFHFGLPAIVSDGVGCQPDLVPDARFGRIFESGNAGDLELAIRQLVGELPGKRPRYAAATQTAIEQFSTAKAAEGILEVARRVVRLKHTHSS